VLGESRGARLRQVGGSLGLGPSSFDHRSILVEKEKRAVSGAPVVRSPSFVYRKATKPGTNRTGASVGGRRRVMLVMLTSEQ